MFLHLGRNVVVHMEEIIAIMDMNSTFVSKNTKEFIRTAEEEGFVKRISDEQIKSIVVTNKIVYFSPISSATLYKRAGFIKDISIV